MPDSTDVDDQKRQALEMRSPRTGLPDAIVTNGPATGVIVVVALYILRSVGVPGSHDRLRTIYIESWARVKRLSLSGRIMLRLADRFIIQWESLRPATNGRGEYRGVLVE